MEKKLFWIVIGFAVTVSFILNVGLDADAGETGSAKMNWKKLTSQEEAVIVDKGTERPFTGIYNDHYEKGVYRCKRCAEPLFQSDSKFKSGCGWPSFDDAIPEAVVEKLDADGQRREILCAGCGAHLGHVFMGEGLTPKNVRHCVNSLSLDFSPKDQQKKKSEKTDQTSREEAFFAGGCFWGVEYHFERVPGVLEAVSGYMGGSQSSPSYEEVCSGHTGHAEAVRVAFDPGKTDFETLARLFFEIHDPTQVNRQGPDIGTQYRSAVYYASAEQKAVTEKLVAKLEKSGYKLATSLEPAATFYPAEDYHQDYYEKNGKEPYCHSRVKRFSD